MERLDLVLSTIGGNITTAHQMALLLREYVQHLTILIPYRARSSGTLLCLSANELVLGPMSELGPIDPHVGSAGPPPTDAPGMISAQDVRAFREMAEQWFGVVREEDQIEVSMPILTAPRTSSDFLVTYNPRGLTPYFCLINTQGVVQARGPLGMGEWPKLQQEWEGSVAIRPFSRNARMMG